MVEFLRGNIFNKLRGGKELFCQMTGIPMETNCVPVLADLFLYFYQTEFLDELIRNGTGGGSPLRECERGSDIF